MLAPAATLPVLLSRLSLASPRKLFLQLFPCFVVGAPPLPSPRSRVRQNAHIPVTAGGPRSSHFRSYFVATAGSLHSLCFPTRAPIPSSCTRLLAPVSFPVHIDPSPDCTLRSTSLSRYLMFSASTSLDDRPRAPTLMSKSLNTRFTRIPDSRLSPSADLCTSTRKYTHRHTHSHHKTSVLFCSLLASHQKEVLL